jgi:hypothetical protein
VISKQGKRNVMKAILEARMNPWLLPDRDGEIRDEKLGLPILIIEN